MPKRGVVPIIAEPEGEARKVNVEQGEANGELGRQFDQSVAERGQFI